MTKKFRHNFRLLSSIPLIMLIVFGMPGCSGSADVPVQKTPTITNSPFPSATIVWFPATSTATQYPTIPAAPTENFHPAVGTIIVEDDFSNVANWSLTSPAGGRITYGKNELTLASQDPKTYIASLNSVVNFQDGWIETSANVSLCKAEDSYGFLVRANSPMDAYRFLINCQGQVKLERLKSGRATTLVDWMQSGQVLPGSPQKVRLQVWIVKNELRFFINEVFQFSARDATLSLGKVGVFARQAAETPLTVSFSSFVVRSIQPGYNLPKATPLPTATSSRKIVSPRTATPPPP
jgi:hypothetical protein